MASLKFSFTLVETFLLFTVLLCFIIKQHVSKKCLETIIVANCPSAFKTERNVCVCACSKSKLLRVLSLNVLSHKFYHMNVAENIKFNYLVNNKLLFIV